MKTIFFITLLSVSGWAADKTLQSVDKNEATFKLQCDTHVSGTSCPSKYAATACPTPAPCIGDLTKNGNLPSKTKGSEK